jgi:O-antigen ligase
MDSAARSYESRGFMHFFIIYLSYAYYILNGLTGINSLMPTVRAAVIMLLTASGAFYIISRGRISFTIYFFWGFEFIFVLICSLLYAPSFELACSGILAYIIIFVPVFIMMQTIESFRDLDRFMDMNLCAGLILSLTSILFYYDELFISGRFYALGNPNSVMILLLHPVNILIFKLMVKKFHRIFYTVSLAACLLVILFTGSRKGIVIPLIFILIFIVMNSGKKILKRSIIIAIVLSVINYLIFNVDELYIALGRRLELFLITLFDSENVTYFSDATRLQLIKSAYAIFIKSPLIGSGINAVEAKYGAYSHNNYTEILSSLGIIGFVAYYWIYAYCMLNIFRVRRNSDEGRDYCDFAIAVLISNLVFDWGGVTYNLLYAMTSLSMSVCIISLSRIQLGDV